MSQHLDWRLARTLALDTSAFIYHLEAHPVSPGPGTATRPDMKTQAESSPIRRAKVLTPM